MTQVRIGRWGRSLAVRIPGDVADVAGIDEGQRVEVAAQDGLVIIRPLLPNFTLDEMFQGKTPEEWRAAYADAYDWGPDMGREVVEE